MTPAPIEPDGPEIRTGPRHAAAHARVHVGVTLIALVAAGVLVVTVILGLLILGLSKLI